jgi:cell wall-associated NlpC family hydrolase
MAAAIRVARTTVVRRLARMVLVALPAVLVAGLAVGLLALLVLTVGSQKDGTTLAGGTCSGPSSPTAASTLELSTEQLANAQTIVAVGRQLGLPAYGWVIAVATALQESALRNLDHGHLDSLGLFQQRDAWGTRQERLDPQSAARMFYSGGRGGQPGLAQIPGYASMPLTRAAQAVQHSAFPDAYARWEPTAKQIVASPAVLSAVCLTAVDYHGDGTTGAKAVAAALIYLGMPYSWGGGGINGPTLGIGPGATTVGFDCSSLVQYAYHAATGLTLPRTAEAQAVATPHLPAGQPLRAGDLLFFHAPGDPLGSYHHVGIYDGQGGMVHAPRTGKTVEVVHDVLRDPYYRSQLALVTRPALLAG